MLGHPAIPSAQPAQGMLAWGSKDGSGWTLRGPFMTTGNARGNPPLRRLGARLSDRAKPPRSWWYPLPPQPLTEKDPDAVAEAHEKCSETIRRAMLALLALALFCLLTALGTSDAALFESALTINVPFADVPISSVAFLIAAPFLLIALSLYLHVFVGHACRLEHFAGAEITKIPTLFNLDHPMAHFLAAFIFYWLVPLVLAVITWKAAAQLVWGLPMLGVTILVLAALLLLQIRRCPGDKRRWQNLPRWALLASIPGVVLWTAQEPEWLHRPLDLFRADLSESWLVRVDLHGANLRHAKLVGANLKEANLLDADLQYADLTDATFDERNLKQARNWLLAFYSERSITWPGGGGFIPVADHNRRVKEKDFRNNASYTDANFRGAELAGANFRNASLYNNDFATADLRKADLRFARLEETNLQGADLRGGAPLQGQAPGGRPQGSQSRGRRSSVCRSNRRDFRGAERKESKNLVPCVL